MARRARLQEFLGHRYTDSKQLRAFIDDTFGLDAVNSIGWEDGVNAETSDLITWLEEHDRVADLWPALRTAFPDLVAEIDTIATDWKPGVIERFVPGVLRRSRKLQIGIASALVIAVVIVLILRMTRESYTAVLVLDGAARDKVIDGATFSVSIDGKVYALSATGLSIGKGDVLPRAVRDAYRAEVPGSGFPGSVRVRLTSKRTAAIRVLFDGRECPKQPRIIADANTLHLITLDDCDPRTVTAVNTERPKIGVRVVVVNSDAFQRLYDVKTNGDPARVSLTEFLAAQLIEQFNSIGMFEFVAASDAIPPERTLVGRIETEWPRTGDVVMDLKLGNDVKQPLTLFRANGCGSPPCSPPDIASSRWYADAFAELVKQWPTGFLKSIALTKTATYESGGVVRTDEAIEMFGQTDGGPPRAVFEISYGDSHQRTFVMCRSNLHQPRKGVGHDIGNASATCVNHQPVSQPSGRDGKVTLFRVLR